MTDLCFAGNWRDATHLAAGERLEALDLFGIAVEILALGFL